MAGPTRRSFTAIIVTSTAVIALPVALHLHRNDDTSRLLSVSPPESSATLPPSTNNAAPMVLTTPTTVFVASPDPTSSDAPGLMPGDQAPAVPDSTPSAVPGTAAASDDMLVASMPSGQPINATFDVYGNPIKIATAQRLGPPGQNKQSITSTPTTTEPPSAAPAPTTTTVAPTTTTARPATTTTTVRPATTTTTVRPATTTTVAPTTTTVRPTTATTVAPTTTTVRPTTTTVAPAPTTAPPTTAPPTTAPPALVVVNAYTHITQGGTPGNPLVIDGRDFRNGLRITANDVVVRNSTVIWPNTESPTVYLLGDRITLDNVVIGGPGGSAEGLRLEGGDSIVVRNVRVPGLQFQTSTAHSDAFQVYLQRNLTNMLVENSYFDGTVTGDSTQNTANGSQLDGGRGLITGTIRNTTFAGGRYFSSRYYNIGGPLVLERVTHVKPLTTNTPEALVIR